MGFYAQVVYNKDLLASLVGHRLRATDACAMVCTHCKGWILSTPEDQPVVYNKDLLARLVGHKGSWRQETLASQFPTWDGSGCTTRICLRTLSAQWTARPGGWGACRCLGVCFFFFLPVTLAERRAKGSRSAKGAEGGARHASIHTSCSGQAPSLCIETRSLAVQRGWRLAAGLPTRMRNRGCPPCR